jgi:hypothetical protein
MIPPLLISGRNVLAHSFTRSRNSGLSVNAAARTASESLSCTQSGIENGGDKSGVLSNTINQKGETIAL